MLLFWIILIVTFGLSLFATARVKSNYARFSKLPASSGLTGAQAAHRILSLAGVENVEIVAGEGVLTDHYDPMRRRLVLSRDNYLGNSVAALGIAAHECGHAIQHKIAYAPLRWRMASVGLTNIASQVVMWLPLIFMFTGMLAPRTGIVVMAIGWGVIMLFNLVTLPVEFDATRRAKVILRQSGMVAVGAEQEGMNKVLNAAGLTYVAAFITSLAYMLYYLLPLILGGRR